MKEQTAFTNTVPRNDGNIIPSPLAGCKFEPTTEGVVRDCMPCAEGGRRPGEGTKEILKRVQDDTHVNHLLTYLPTNLLTSGKTKVAFTLAEVLITLTIIGVVAALTMPALIAKHQEQEFVTRLKKTYSTTNNAFRQMMADDGVENFADTEFISKYIATVGSEDVFDEETGERSYTCNPATINYLSKYIKGEPYDKEWNYTYLSGSKLVRSHNRCDNYVTTDGSLIKFSTYRGAYKPQARKHVKVTEMLSLIIIDVDGPNRGPQIYGRDIFMFYLGNDGNLYPRGGHEYATYSAVKDDGTINYTVFKNRLWTATAESCSTERTSQGYGCAGRIMEEGWQMNY